MIFVKDLNKEIFSSPFLEYLPQTCDSCGSPVEILETLNVLQCSNPHCISKVGYRLFALLEQLGINYLSVDECIKFLERFDTLNPYNIFMYNPSEDGELLYGYGMEASQKFYADINKRRGMLLWEFIELGHFENLNVSAEKLLKDYTNIEDFYQSLVEEGIPFIQKKLLKETEYDTSSDVCVDAVLIFEVFMNYKEEIEEGLQGVVILKPERTMKILFANDSEGFNSNQDFLFNVNNILQNKIYLYQGYILDDTISFVFWHNVNLNMENSLIKKVKEEYPNIKIVNEENIFSTLLEVFTHEKQ